MNKKSRRESAGHVFDRTGRIIDGVIDNGRLLLMIALVASFALLVHELEDLTDASRAATPELTKDSVVTSASPFTTAEHAATTRVRDRSDYRIRLHRQCAQDAFRRTHRERCDALAQDVADAVQEETLEDIRNSDIIDDGETSLDPVVLAGAQRSI